MALSLSTWTTVVWAYGPAGQQISTDQNPDSSADYANSGDEKTYIFTGGLLLGAVHLRAGLEHKRERLCSLSRQGTGNVV